MAARSSRLRVSDQVHEPVDLGLIDLEAARTGLVVFGAAAKLDSIVGDWLGGGGCSSFLFCAGPIPSATDC